MSQAENVIDAQRPATDKYPFVSVIIPVRNEEAFIARTLDRILTQDYPLDRLEVIVADGMSDDRTREILAEYGRRHPQVRVVDNPSRVTPAGLNAAITAAKGEIISRIDGHCEVANDFVRQNVQLLEEHPEAWVVGGPMVHAGKNTFGEAVAVAMSHPAGVGLARHRFEGFEGYVEGAQFPAFRQWVFDRIGMFDENLVRTEDDELNYRIAQAGGKSFVSPRVKYVYYVRGKIGQLFKQYFHYSFWRIPVIRKHKRPTTLRQMVPPLFFLAMIVLAAVGVWLRQPLVALALPAIYAAALLAIAATIVPRKGLAVASMVPLAMVTMHVAYAAGIVYGFICLAFHRRAWELGGSMTSISR
ncbi:MAG: glycosyltransferase family 2 protein [Pirellulales bacterium]